MIDSEVVQGPDKNYGVSVKLNNEEVAVLRPMDAIQFAHHVIQDALDAIRYDYVALEAAERVAGPVDEMLKQLAEVEPQDPAEMTGDEKLALLEQMGFRFNKVSKSGKVTISSTPGDVVQAATARHHQAGPTSDGD